MTPEERDGLPSCGQGRIPPAVCTACADGQADPCWTAAEAVEHGDLRQAALFYARACELGHLRACNNLGNAYKLGILPEPAGVRGVLLEETACRVALRHCLDGRDKACYAAAMCSQQAHGGSSRDVRARLGEACEHGDGDSCAAIASRTTDHASMLALYARGCEAGSTYACTDLGSMQVLGLDRLHGREDGYKLLANTCERTGSIETCEAAAGYLPWRWYSRLHQGVLPDEAFTPMRARGEVRGPKPAEPAPRFTLTWYRVCFDSDGAVARAQYAIPSARPDRDALFLAMLSKWRIDRVTSRINPCWGTSSFDMHR